MHEEVDARWCLKIFVRILTSPPVSVTPILVFKILHTPCLREVEGEVA